MKKRNAFTLIEVLVVLAIISVIAGTTALSFSGMEARGVRHEADRLAALIQAARDAAVLNGRTVVLAFDDGGYDFLMTDGTGVLAPSDDDTLKAHRYPGGITMEFFRLEGRALADKPRLALAPTGAIPSFALEIGSDTSRFDVHLDDDGAVIAESAHA